MTPQKLLLASKKKILDKRSGWEKDFARNAKVMKEFAAEKEMDTHWLRIMDNTAAKRELTITRRGKVEEKEIAGERKLYDLQLDKRNLENKIKRLENELTKANNQEKAAISAKSDPSEVSALRSRLE